MLDWLIGIPARPISTGIYEIHITGYGPADVGAYDDLLRHVGRGSGLECHHIVEKEHLRMISTRFTERQAPAVAIPQDLHRKLISPRFTAEQTTLGGRHGGRAEVSKAELLDLYEQVYRWHTPFTELYAIARQILR
ncbi:hypothetical protein DRQ50_14015 [bacterium]|nr:MAG: hypothetical protein DRQ50_14015 [bacterium]